MAAINATTLKMRVTRFPIPEASFQAPLRSSLTKKSGKCGDEGRAERAPCQECEQRFRDPIGGVIWIERAPGIESPGDKDVSCKTDNLAENQGEHHCPGGAGDLAICGGLFSHEEGL